ncbi:DEAD/DEAH box helicase family protein (plasmid) [Shewanella sp. HL-SH4]|uniref:DEAD/DEAH box helicase family protein n=1 Tax=Shewanella sp. HL-SH4 TaxID=3436240 RepID=UPI003EC09CDC
MDAVQNIEYVGGQTGFFFGTEAELETYIKQSQALCGKKAKFKVQIAAKNFHHFFPLSKLSVITRYNHNVKAIRTLLELQNHQSDASYAEQVILAEYQGWGGVPQAFDMTTSNSKWLKRCNTLKNLLTDQQYTAARASTLSSFYTPDSIAEAIYAGLESAGVNMLKNGAWLDTSAGVGGLLRTMPASISDNVKLTLVERDDISAQILEQLYPDANIHHSAFERANLPHKFDVVFQNPPFGSATVFDKDSTFSGLTLHNYFMTKSASMLNDNGWMIALVSSSFMDAKNPKNRQLLSQYASLKAAVRLPKNVFETATGANATVDLLVFEQGSDTVNVNWIESQTQQDENGNDYSINNYYIENPAQIIGKMEVGANFRGNSVHCIAGDDFEPLSIEAIKRTLSSLKFSVNTTTKAVKSSNVAATQQSVVTMVETIGTKEGSYCVSDNDEIYQLVSGSWVATEFSGKAKDRLVGLCGLRYTLMSLLDAEQNDLDVSKMDALRLQLNQRYQAFVKVFGFIHDAANQRVCRLDPTNYNLLSLECDYSAGVTKSVAKKLNVSEVKPSCKQAEIFNQRVLYPWEVPTSASCAEDALLSSLNIHGKVDVQFCADLLSIDINSFISMNEGHLIFNDHGTWFTKNVYQSGDIKTKLEDVKHSNLDPELKQLYVNALVEVTPVDVAFEDIAINLGASWVPSSIYEAFVMHLCDGKQNRYSKIKINYINNEWLVELYNLPHSLETRLGNNDHRFSYLMPRLMNGRSTQVTYKDANNRRVVNKEATLNNELNSELILAEWDNFLLNDQAIQTQLEQIFNVKFNRYTPIQSPKDAIFLPNANQTIKLRDHQNRAVYRAITEGRLLINHCVGAGKSYTIAAIAKLLISLKLKQRVVIVCPNHLTSQLAAQYLTLFPADQITVLAPDDLSPAARQATLLRIKTGSSIVIMPESSFTSIPVDADVEQEVIEKEINKLADSLNEANKKGQRFSVKAMETQKENLETRLLELTHDKRKKGLSISELGIDALILDEAHSIKNLSYTSSRLANVKGTNTPIGSKRALDWYMKIQCLKKNNKNGLGVFFSTGTPIANSLLEVYTFSRYLNEEALEAQGIDNIDSWVSSYAKIANDFEISPTGQGFKTVSRLRAFNNISLLKVSWSMFTDSILAKELINYIPKIEVISPDGSKQLYDAIPPVTGGKPRQIVVEPTDLQLDFSKLLVKRAQCFSSSPVKNDNMLAVLSDARKASIDMRLFNSALPADQSGNKIPTTAKVVADKYHETTAVKGVQIIFLDLGVPNRNGRHSVYDDLKSQLIIEHGVKAEEIVFAQSFKTSIQKNELYSKLNAGTYRVIIASTATLGCGANINKKLVAVTLVDSPYRPCDLEQRLGRIIRQGSELYHAKPATFTIDVNFVATKNTLDAYLFQILQAKQSFISQFHSTNDLGVKTCEDISSTELTFAELKAETSGSPLVLEMVSLTKTIQMLEAKKNSFIRNKRNAQNDITSQTAAINKFSKLIKNLHADAALNLDEVKGDSFSYTNAQGQLFNKHNEAATNMHEQLKGTAAAINAGYFMEKDIALGSFAGFELNVSVVNTTMQLVITSANASAYKFTLNTYSVKNMGASILATINDFIRKINDHIIQNENRLIDAQDRLQHAQKVEVSEFNEMDLLTDSKRSMVELRNKIAQLEQGQSASESEELDDDTLLTLAA